MKIEKENVNEQLDYNEIIKIMEKNLDYLKSIGFDNKHIGNYRKILDYLHRKTNSEIVHIMNGKVVKYKKHSPTSEKFSDLEIKKLNRDDIKKILTVKSLTRYDLERIAIVRFSVPKGSLSALRNRNMLIEKILTLLTHEDTHDIISMAASGEGAMKDNDER